MLMGWGTGDPGSYGCVAGDGVAMASYVIYYRRCCCSSDQQLPIGNGLIICIDTSYKR